MGSWRVDARFTVATATAPNAEVGDFVLSLLLTARSSFVLPEGGLQQYTSQSNPAAIGEAYALVGYSELLMAEAYCGGVPLSQGVAQGGWSYGAPLSTDSLLATAQAHFDSALKYDANDNTVTPLASVGLARTLLDRDSLAQAAAAVTQVPTGFVYNTELEPTSAENVQASYAGGGVNLWEGAIEVCADFVVSDQEGGNGLNYVSAQDPRLVTVGTVATACDVAHGYAGAAFYYPLKFGNPSTGLIPLATGIEARLIEAEAALQATPNDTTTWLRALNMLRNTGCPDANQADCAYGTAQVPAQSSGLFSLTDPGNNPVRVSLLFRERAFWLFGTGTRLGDMRRLIRQYSSDGFQADNVFPMGSYGISGSAAQLLYPTYGSDVDLTLPTPSSGDGTTNAYYKGCLPGAGTTVP